jgi:glyoxylase-like metal-dependent hydrolase (beta-lactamase superfamily II)
LNVVAAFTEIVRGVSLYRDTCNVYVLRSGREAVLIDFGSGAVLDRLGELGVDRVTDVLVTHHHRDQVQGLDRAVAASHLDATGERSTPDDYEALRRSWSAWRASG